MKKKSAIKWAEAGLLPYGILPTFAKGDDEKPKGWIKGAKSFLAWRKLMLNTIAETLWPTVDTEKRLWKGGAVDFMAEITRADLEILKHIRKPDSPLLDQVPDSSLRTDDCPRHSELFDREDYGGNSKVTDTVRAYDKQFPEDFLRHLPGLFNRGVSAKVSLGLIFWFKEQLQRPRPYQAALWLGRATTHIEAKSGLHPAIISGHCLQGMSMLLATAEDCELRGVALSDDDWAAFSQFFVDYGDRRVMAGVHYPSDNLASWMIALDLCEFTVDARVRKAVHQRVWDAITKRSAVYRIVDKEQAKPRSPYRLAFKELHRRDPSGLK